MPIDPAERARRHQLFVRYHATGDGAVRDELVVANLRLALHLARRFANRGVAVDDLEQVASLALLRAIDRYDPHRQVEFSTFATPTILGELKRHFRDKGWSVRVPRRVQELSVTLNALVAELTHQLDRSPTIGELALAARASEEEVLEAMEAGQAYRAQPLGLDDQDGAPPVGLGVEDAGLFEAENRVVVEALLARLPRREQLLLRMRFYDDMSQREIAARLGVSQMHVSRLLARVLDALRQEAAAAGPG